MCYSMQSGTNSHVFGRTQWLFTQALHRARCIQLTHSHPIIFYIGFHILLSSECVSSKWSLSCRFCDQSFICISHPSFACYMSCPHHWFAHPNIIWCSLQIMQLIIVPFSQPFASSPLGPAVLLQVTFSNILNLMKTYMIIVCLSVLYWYEFDKIDPSARLKMNCLKAITCVLLETILNPLAPNNIYIYMSCSEPFKWPNGY